MRCPPHNAGGSASGGKAALVISHGSRTSKTKDEVKVLVDKLKSLTGLALIEYAFLELESPSIPDGIASCVQKGATEIVILLNFLNAGRHVDVDVPAIVEESRKKFPQVNITKPVGQHPAIPKLFAEMLSPFK